MQGTYNQLKIDIDKVEITGADGITRKAKLSRSQFTFNQNFTITAKNTTTLTVDFDLLKSVAFGAKGQATFDPWVNLVFTRTPGSMEITPENLMNGAIDSPYYSEMRVIGGQRPYTWLVSMGDLPPGLQLDQWV
jgi:hypothetical protein